ncbi:MAG: histidinol-phosphate transaminase [Candidatus Dormibacteria bacterium]
MTRRPPRARAYLDHMPRYAAGSSAVRADGAPGHKLSSNESPYPLPESMVTAMAAAAVGANRYPGDGRELARRLAEKHSVPPDTVAVAGGSLELLRDLLTAYAGHDSEVVFGWRSYEAYPILVQSLGARSVRVPLRDERLDLTALAAAIHARTRVVLLANPNNPSGTVVAADALGNFAKAVPDECLLILDEAYSEYADPELGGQGIALARSQPNIVVMRTFSKAYALAGMRIGWCVADPEVVETVAQVALPFTLTTVAQAAAVAALDQEELLAGQVRATVAERERVRTNLVAAGFTVPVSGANFLWLPLGARSQGFAEECRTAGISVRCFPGDGVRVTIGTSFENDGFLEFANSYLGAGG